jgi:hypothetical protein
MPTVGWDDRAMEWPSMEIVNAVLSSEPLNMLDWMVNQMLECKKNVDAPLILQPYIMVLMLCTVRDFRGACEITREVYIPFLGHEHYLSRDLSPVALGILRLHSLGMSKSSFYFIQYRPRYGFTWNSISTSRCLRVLVQGQSRLRLFSTAVQCHLQWCHLC